RREVLQRQPGDVGGRPEEGGMAEGEIAGEAKQDGEAERKQGPHGNLGGERLIAADGNEPPGHGKHDRGEGGKDEEILTRQEPRRPAAAADPLIRHELRPVHSNTPALPNRPRGRTSSTITATR